VRHRSPANQRFAAAPRRSGIAQRNDVLHRPRDTTPRRAALPSTERRVDSSTACRESAIRRRLRRERRHDEHGLWCRPAGAGRERIGIGVDARAEPSAGAHAGMFFYQIERVPDVRSLRSEAANPTIWLPEQSDAIEFHCGAARCDGTPPSKARESGESQLRRSTGFSHANR
jgi:hypothetical protein